MCWSFLCIVLFVMAVIPRTTFAKKTFNYSATYTPVPIDFSPFRGAIRAAITNSQKEGIVKPISPTSTSKDCAMPQSSIMFSYTNNYTFDLALLQHESLNAWGLRDCLQSRFVLACLDTGCMERCQEHNVPNCAELTLPPVPPSDYGEGAYSYMTWMKQDLLKESLSVVNEVLFFDADVLVMRNPWPHTQMGRMYNGTRIKESFGTYDIMYSRDRGSGLDCAGTINTGIIYARNTSATRELFGRMEEMKGDVIEGKDGYHQAHFQAVRPKVKDLRACSLDPNRFLNQCSAKSSFNNVRYIGPTTPLRQVIAYHTACVAGEQRKVNRMKSFLNQVQTSPTKTISDALNGVTSNSNSSLPRVRKAPSKVPAVTRTAAGAVTTSTTTAGGGATRGIYNTLSLKQNTKPARVKGISTAVE